MQYVPNKESVVHPCVASHHIQWLVDLKELGYVENQWIRVTAPLPSLRITS